MLCDADAGPYGRGAGQEGLGVLREVCVWCNRMGWHASCLLAPHPDPERPQSAD